MTITEAAEKLGVTSMAIHKRVGRGQLTSHQARIPGTNATITILEKAEVLRFYRAKLKNDRDCERDEREWDEEVRRSREWAARP